MKRTYTKLICIFIITLLLNCKATKESIQKTQTTTSDIKIDYTNSLKINRNKPITNFPINSAILTKLNQELIFKDFAPSYYFHKWSIFHIPNNIKSIKTTGNNEFYNYFFDKNGRIDSLSTDRFGSYKVYYSKNGMIDYIKNSKKSTYATKEHYIVYFSDETNTITKYETENTNVKLAFDEFENKFTYNNKGEIIKTNYGKSYEKNYIEYYTLIENNSTIKLMKSQVHTYFFIKGYKLDENGQIIAKYFTNDNINLTSNSIDLNKIFSHHSSFQSTFDSNKRLVLLSGAGIKHKYEYYD